MRSFGAAVHSLAEMALRELSFDNSSGNSVQCLDLIMKASDEQIGNISKHIETVTTLLSVCGNFMQFNALRVLLNMGDEDLARVQAHSELIRDLVRISEDSTQLNALQVLLKMGDEDLARVQAHSEFIRG